MPISVPGDLDLLLEIAMSLPDENHRTILVEGHTDDRPLGPGLRRRFPTNRELSAARAMAVVRFLQGAGRILPEPPHRRRFDAGPLAAGAPLC